MKILSIVHRYYPAVGGAEYHMRAINRRLVERGHDVTVLTTDAADFALFWDPKARRFEEHDETVDSVRILRFPVQHMPFSNYAYPAARLLTGQVSRLFPQSQLVNRLTELTPNVPNMRRWMQTNTEQFDVVLGMPITLEGIIKLGEQFAQQKSIPFVLWPLTHLGAGAAPGTDRVSRFYTLPQQQQMVLQAAGLVANNLAERDFYLQRGMAAEKIIVAPPAPDPDQLLGGEGARWRAQHSPDDIPLVVVVSALTRDKGTLQTLDAMRQLWRQGVQAKLVLAGSPMADFERYLAQMPASEKEHLIVRGKISDAERNDLLDAADIFCMPSVVESFGLAFTEAMLYKTPVIGADVWGVKEFVIRPNENGLLVKAGEVAALAEQIKRLLDDKTLAAKLGEAGYAYASQLSWEDSLNKIEPFLQRLTASHHQTGQAA